MPKSTDKMPKVEVTCADNHSSATVSITFPWLKQAMAFADICRAILIQAGPLVEGEDKKIVEMAED